MSIQQFTQDLNPYGLQIQSYVNEKFGFFVRAVPFYTSLVPPNVLEFEEDTVYFLSDAYFISDDDEVPFTAEVFYYFDGSFLFEAETIAVEPNGIKHYSRKAPLNNIFLIRSANIVNGLYRNVMGYKITYKADPKFISLKPNTGLNNVAFDFSVFTNKSISYGEDGLQFQIINSVNDVVVFTDTIGNGNLTTLSFNILSRNVTLPTGTYYLKIDKGFLVDSSGGLLPEILKSDNYTLVIN